MTAGLDRPVPERATRAPSLLVSVAAPLLVVVLAAVAWAISDRLLVIGPFDRAAFGWFVVVPVWLAAAPVAALRWGGLGSRDRTLAGAAVLVIVAAATAAVLITAFAGTTCETRLLWPVVAYLPGSMLVGGLLGAGPALGGLVGARAFGAGGRIRAGAVSVAVAAAMSLLSIAAAVALLMTPLCDRP